MQTAIQLFDLGGQGLNTAGGAQKIAVKMPTSGRWTGQQEPADGFAAVMSMLMALPEEDLRTSLSLLDWVPLEEAGDQLVPVIDLTASEGSGFQMFAQMLQSVETPRQAPLYSPGEPDMAPGPVGKPAFFNPAQDQAAAAAVEVIEYNPTVSTPVGIPVENAVPEPVVVEPPANHTQALPDAGPVVRPDAGFKEAAGAVREAALPLEKGERKRRGLPTQAAGAESEIEPAHKPRLSAGLGAPRTAPGAPQMTQARVPAEVTVPPETGQVSEAAAKPAETVARVISGQGAVAGAAEEMLPDMASPSGSGGREQLGILAQKPQAEVTGPSAEPAAEKQSALPLREPAAADIMRQIVARMTLRTDRSQSQMHIRLKPEFLGDVRLQVATENQQVMVRISAQSQAVKEMIEQNVLQLKNELQQHGLQIDKFDVFVGTDSGNFRQRRNPATAEQRYANRHGRPAQRGAAEVDGPMSVDAGQIGSTRGGVDFFA